MKILTIKETKQVLNELIQLSSEQEALAIEMISELDAHPIDDPGYRDLCFEVKQLVRDLELTKVLLLTQTTRSKKIKPFSPYCDNCDLKHRHQLQAVLINEVIRIADVLSTLLTEAQHFYGNRKIVTGIKSVNTSFN